MNRIERLQRRMEREKIDLLLIEDPRSILYLLALQFSMAKLLISTKEVQLIVDGRYTTYAQERSIYPVHSLDDWKTIIADHKESALFFPQETTTYQRFTELATIASSCHKQLIPCRDPVLAERYLKEPEELSLLRKACALGSECYDHLLTMVKEGIRECDLQLELELFARKEGASQLAFEPIIAFGANTAQPHYHTGDRKLAKGDIVLLDLGVTYCGYQSDMTRTLFFDQVDPRMVEIYECVLEAQERALSLCRPGISISDIDRAARSHIESMGYGALFCHSTGHGVGLEIHEPPAIRAKRENDELLLEEGVVITVEPGIYLPGVGGVRIEDTVAITKDSHENLTQRDKKITIIH